MKGTPSRERKSKIVRSTEKYATLAKCNDEEKKEQAVTRLAVTLTYRLHSSVNPRNQFQETIGQIENLLHMCCDNYGIYPELTRQGDIHYHLSLNIKDKIKWFKKCLPSFKKNGYVLVKPVFDLSDWLKYCLKDNEMMEDILNVKLPISQLSYKSPKEKKREEDVMSELDLGIARFYLPDELDDVDSDDEHPIKIKAYKDDKSDDSESE